MLNFFERLYAAALDSFYAEPVIWWGALALTAVAAGVVAYVNAKREAQR